MQISAPHNIGHFLPLLLCQRREKEEHAPPFVTTTLRSTPPQPILSAGKGTLHTRTRAPSSTEQVSRYDMVGFGVNQLHRLPDGNLRAALTDTPNDFLKK